MTNPKCLGRAFPDTFSARSAHLTGLKMRRITRAASLDHLVGSGEQLIRHREAEHPRGPGVDDQLELGRLHDRQIRRLRALEDAAGIDADLTKRIRNVGSVAHQPADFGKLTRGICRGERVARRQVDQLGTSVSKKNGEADEYGVWPVAHKSCEGRIDLTAGAGVEYLDLQRHGVSSGFGVP